MWSVSSSSEMRRSCAFPGLLRRRNGRRGLKNSVTNVTFVKTCILHMSSRNPRVINYLQLLHKLQRKDRGNEANCTPHQKVHTSTLRLVGVLPVTGLRRERVSRKKSSAPRRSVLFIYRFKLQHNESVVSLECAKANIIIIIIIISTIMTTITTVM